MTRKEALVVLLDGKFVYHPNLNLKFIRLNKLGQLKDSTNTLTSLNAMPDTGYEIYDCPVTVSIKNRLVA